MAKVTTGLERCGWCLGDDLYLSYHDHEWGVPNVDDARLFEFLILEGAQAGLSWITVLRKRENYLKAVDGFDAEKIARYSEARVARLMANSGIIRNKLKINSMIRNAQAYLTLQQQGTSFSDFLWAFVDYEVRQNNYKRLDQVPAATPESEAMSRALKQKGFNFVGSTICYAFMQATGMVNDHLVTCFRHQQCLALAPKR